MLNYQKLIQKYAYINLDNGLIKSEDKELYEYGYLLMALQLINIAGVVIIGVLFKCLMALVLFTISMISLRSYTGGYHASSPERCTLFSLILKVAVALTLNLVMDFGHFTWVICIALAGQLMIWKLAPVEAVNKPLSPEEFYRYRKKSRRILLLELVLLLACVAFRAWPFALAIALCHITTALLVLAAYINGKFKI